MRGAIFDHASSELSAEPTAARPAGIGGATHVIWPETGGDRS